jgi:hypothetical protein
MRTLPSKPLLALAFPLALLAACGGGGGGGGGSATVVEEAEPNDAPAAAGALAVGGFGHGTVPDGSDTDFWGVVLAAGEVVSVEVFANRLDQATWASGPNAAKVTLLDTDGASVLLEQGDGQFAWNAEQDTDIHAFRAPAAGTYYLRVDVDDPLVGGGDYLIAVRSASQAAPLQLELEPAGASGANDSDLVAETIVPGTVSGFFVDDETDWYELTLAAPSLVSFTMHAHRNGVWQGDDSLYDSALDLLDSGLNVLAVNDDCFYLDSSIHHALALPGTYFLVVSECCGTGDSGYDLEFTSTALAPLAVSEVEPNDSTVTAQSAQFGAWIEGDVTPLDDDFYAFACTAGYRLQVEVFDAGNLQGALDDVVVTIEDGAAGVLPVDAGGALQIHRTILVGSGTYLVHVASAGTTDYALRVTETPGRFENEPNDTAANAGSFDGAGLAAGVIDVAADADLFAFSATMGVPVVLSCIADNGVGAGGFAALDGFGSGLAPVLAVKDAGGTILASSNSLFGTAVGVVDGLASVSLAFLPPATGTYYAEVVDQGGNSGANFTFVLVRR